MAFYIVVHHPSDPHQPYANEWAPDGFLRSFETSRSFVREHSGALRQGERIFVHRCSWGDSPPVICCSVKVQEVTDYFVRLAPIMLMNETPPVHPMHGCGHYYYG
jgi:hypothetical protein